MGQLDNKINREKKKPDEGLSNKFHHPKLGTAVMKGLCNRWAWGLSMVNRKWYSLYHAMNRIVEILGIFYQQRSCFNVQSWNLKTTS